ncbi:hypothetical protein PFISCL1PPCAC_23865, partial [Pristionchus fissidentatus]
SSRAVQRAEDGAIHIVQEISLYAEEARESKVYTKLFEVFPSNKVHGRSPADTKARVFIGDSIVKVHVETTIR